MNKIRYISSILLALSLSVSPYSLAQYTILFLGDSLTEGYGLEPDQAFPNLIEQKLKTDGRDDIRVINGGLSGSTSASALSRLNWYLQSQPNLMVLSMGANDGLRGLTVEQMKNNLSRTIELALENDVQVALTGMLTPPNMGTEYSSSFAQVFPDLANQYNLPFLPFLLDGVAAAPTLNQSDGIHPNVEGTKIVAENVLNFVLPLLPDIE